MKKICLINTEIDFTGKGVVIRHEGKKLCRLPLEEIYDNILETIIETREKGPGIDRRKDEVAIIRAARVYAGNNFGFTGRFLK